jgi:hypothetical protein
LAAKFVFVLIALILASTGAFAASCTINSVNPSTIFKTQSTTVNISYSDFTSGDPNSFTSIDCNGGATASGLTCTAATCTLTCSPYATDGTYTIENLLGLSNGTETADCSGTAQLTISNRAPIAILKADPHQGNPPLTITFSGACSDPDGNAIKTCFLDYYDGNGEEIVAPYYFSGKTHTYYTVKDYYPELMVKDDQDANNSSRARETINVIAPAAPTINNKSPAHDSSTNDTTPTISFDVNDNGSGVDIATLKLFVDNAVISSPAISPPFNNNYHVSWTSGTLANGKVVYIGLRVADTLGHSTDANWNFTVDTEPPTSLSIKINSDNTYTSSRDVTLTLSATGASQCRAKNDDDSWGSWDAYTTSKSWTLRDSDGTRTVYFQCKDSAGNESNLSDNYDSIVLDRQTPNTVSGFNAVYDKTNDEVDLDWDKPSDRGDSGIDHYCLYRGTTSTFSDMSQVSCSIDKDDTDFENDAGGLDDDRTYYYRIKAVDRAGNISDASDSASVTIGVTTLSGDTTVPYLTWRQSPAANSTVSGIVTLEVEAYDPQSDIQTVSFYVDNAQINVSNTVDGDYYSIDWNSASVVNGSHVLKVRATNNSGNTGHNTTTKEITVTTNNAGAALTPEQSTARNAINEADDAKEEAAALFNEASKMGISFSGTAGKLLSDGSGLLDEANGLFDDANYSGAVQKADSANAKFERLLGIISIEEYSGVQVYSFSSEKLQVLLQGIGLKKELADEAQALLQNFTVNRSTAFKEITDGSNTYYKAAIRVVIKNNGTERKTVQLIEVIPKGFADEANKITASSEFTVIVADPVVKWVVSVPAGAEKEITYALKENLSKEAMDALIAKEPMQLFVAPPVLLGGNTIVAALDFTPAPATPTGFFALPDLGSVGTLALVLVIVAAIAIALFAYYRGSGGSGNFGASEGMHNFGMQEGLGKRLGGRVAGLGRAREKEQRPRWEFKG